MNKSLHKLPRAEQWADQICMQLVKSVESIIEVGRLLVKAKADLVHGEWGRLFEDGLIPFSRQTASKLIAIADNPQLSNVAHVRHLPPAWGTLYELTKLPEPTLKHALADGLITPDMSRSAVKDLIPVDPKASSAKTNRGVRSAKPGSLPDEPTSDDFAPETRCLFDVEARIRQTYFGLGAEERAQLALMIQQLLTNLQNEALRLTA